MALCVQLKLLVRQLHSPGMYIEVEKIPQLDIDDTQCAIEIFHHDLGHSLLIKQYKLYLHQFPGLIEIPGADNGFL